MQIEHILSYRKTSLLCRLLAQFYEIYHMTSVTCYIKFFNIALQSKSSTLTTMFNIIRKVKSTPIFSSKVFSSTENTPPPVKKNVLTHAQLVHQVELLDELVDLMINEAIFGVRKGRPDPDRHI